MMTLMEAGGEEHIAAEAIGTFKLTDTDTHPHAQNTRQVGGRQMALCD